MVDSAVINSVEILPIFLRNTHHSSILQVTVHHQNKISTRDICYCLIKYNEISCICYNCLLKKKLPYNENNMWVGTYLSHINLFASAIILWYQKNRTRNFSITLAQDTGMINYFLVYFFVNLNPIIINHISIRKTYLSIK